MYFYERIFFSLAFTCRGLKSPGKGREITFSRMIIMYFLEIIPFSLAVRFQSTAGDKFAARFQSTAISGIIPILIFLFPISLFSQINNDTAIFQLLKPYFEENGYSYKSISGYDFQSQFPDLKADTTLTTQLNISQPRVFYRKLEDKQYQREIRINIGKIEAEKSTQTLIFHDTISAQTLRKINKSSSEPFRGEDPTPLAKWMKPDRTHCGQYRSCIVLVLYQKSIRK